MVRIARRLGCSVPLVIFRFIMDIGILPLTGTTSERHMQRDLEAEQLNLDADDLGVLERLAE